MRRPALLLGVLLLLAGCGDARRDAEDRAAAVHAPGEGMAEAAAAAPTLPSGRYLTARVLARTQPARDAPAAASLHRLGARTEFGSRRVLGVTAPARRLARRRRPRAPERPRRLDPRAPRGAGEHELVSSTSTARRAG